MKIVFAISILLGLLFMLSFSIEDDKINWDTSYKLKWTDFKALPKIESDVSAVSTISINYKIIRDGMDLKLTICTEFIKDKSWVRSDAKIHQSLLNHEQGHFDLYEVFSRKIRREITYSKFTSDNYKDKISNLYDSLVDLCIEKNQQYDYESMLSQDSVGQAKWDKYISNELDNLIDFSNTKTSIRLR